MAKVIARHLSVDMYNCKPERINELDNPKDAIVALFERNGFTVFDSAVHVLNSGHKTMTLIFSEGHCAINSFHALGYVAIDFFLCEPGASPEKLFNSIRDIFQPDKTKTTFLKRGDFGTVADMKPKVSTKYAPLRRIHNTGARVIRMLARHRK